MFIYFASFFLYFLFQLLDGKFAKEVSHKVDGVIFQPVPTVGLELDDKFLMLFSLTLLKNSKL